MTETRAVRRRVVYIAGYDPNPPADRHALLTRELQRDGERTGIRYQVGKLDEQAPGAFSSWSVTAQGPGWSSTTDYLMPRWDDIVRADFAKPMPQRWARLVWMTLRTFLDGTFSRMAKASHVFVLFWLYPVVTTILVSGGACVLAQAFTGLLAPMNGVWPAAFAGLVVFVMALIVFAHVCRATYLMHLMELWLFARDYAEGKRSDVEARARQIGDLLAHLAARTDVDETIVVGHSYGTVIGTQALSHAIATRPDVFRTGAPVAFLTLGALHGAVATVPGADAVRARITALCATDSLLWVELISRQDVLNFCRTAPWRFFRDTPDPAWPNPTVYPFSLRDTLNPDTYKRFRRNFFRMHFQWIMANDKPFRYDYPAIVVGPTGFAERFGLEWPRDIGQDMPRRTGGVAQRTLRDA